MELTDEELIERARVGDETAFGFLVDKYKGAVHALAYRKLGDYHEAEDITQEAFLRAYQKLSTLRERTNRTGFKKYAMSDKHGKFTISGLNPGQKLSLKAKQEELHLRGSVDIEAQPGAEVELLLEEYETISVFGRVTAPKGKPIAGANNCSMA